MISPRAIWNRYFGHNTNDQKEISEQQLIWRDLQKSKILQQYGHRFRTYRPYFAEFEIRLVNPDAQVPHRAKETDAGYDIYSVQDVDIEPLTYREVDTGIQLACPKGWYYTIDGRSSMHRAGIVASRGIIDATYTGTIFVQLYNKNTITYRVKKGERIAQFTVHRVIDAGFKIVETFSEAYDVRGTSGFGSTGK